MRTGGACAVAVMGAALTAAPSAAQAKRIVNVPCSTASLVTAITNANTAGGDTLRLAASCTYALTAPVSPPGSRGPNGLPIITGNITILGGPSTTIQRTGTPQFRIFEVATSGILSVQNVFVVGGNAGLEPGGGLLNSRGHVVLTNVTLTGNVADNGAAIANDSGHVQLVNTLVNNNSTRASGGGGGGVYNDGFLEADNSVIRNNAANTSGGGVYNELGATSRFDHVTLNANTAAVNGGAIYNGVGGTARFTATLVQSNTAAGGGGIFNASSTGAVPLSGSVVTGNVPNNCVPLGGIPGCTG